MLKTPIITSTKLPIGNSISPNRLETAVYRRGGGGERGYGGIIHFQGLEDSYVEPLIFFCNNWLPRPIFRFPNDYRRALGAPSHTRVVSYEWGMGNRWNLYKSQWAGYIPKYTGY